MEGKDTSDQVDLKESSSFYSFSQNIWQQIPSLLSVMNPLSTKNHEVSSGINGDVPFSAYKSLPGTPKPRVEEVIELASFGVVQTGMAERVGKGHVFLAACLETPTWCDKCGDLVWSIGRSQLVRCEICNFSCHTHCVNFITLDCQPPRILGSGIKHTHKQQARPMKIDDFKREELMHLINEHNRSYPDMEMSLAQRNDRSFVATGFVRVCMNLMRPINVISGTRPPSIYDALKQDETLGGDRTLTSFYLPVDTIKALHVDTYMTAREVIVTLLRKFKVADSPLKYALYESSCGHNDEISLRRLSDEEVPLILALSWFRDGYDRRQFLMQENDCTDIDWNMFALPELENFVKILDIEEKEYLRQIKEKYSVTHKILEGLIEQKSPRTVTHEDDRYY